MYATHCREQTVEPASLMNSVLGGVPQCIKSMFLQTFAVTSCVAWSALKLAGQTFRFFAGYKYIYFNVTCALGPRLKPTKSALQMWMVTVTVVITGFCQPDKVNLRLILTEVLCQFQANNYHLPNYQQTWRWKTHRQLLRSLIGAHQGGIMYTADSWSWITGCLYNVISTASWQKAVGGCQSMCALGSVDVGHSFNGMY